MSDTHRVNWYDRTNTFNLSKQDKDYLKDKDYLNLLEEYNYLGYYDDYIPDLNED